jgi:putative transposase
MAEGVCLTHLNFGRGDPRPYKIITIAFIMRFCNNRYMGFEDRPNRRTVRLQDYDYSNAGAYFITVCTYHKIETLGHITADRIVQSKEGEIVATVWRSIPDRFPGVDLDEYMLMPNHIHGIIMLPDRYVQYGSTATGNPSLGKIIAYFKYLSTKLINQYRNQIGERMWQRNYYEHVIRDEHDLSTIREYIQNNPRRWTIDRFYSSGREI